MTGLSLDCLSEIKFDVLNLDMSVNVAIFVVN